MSQFRYRALNVEGSPELGIVEAANWEAAKEYLASQGFHAVQTGGQGDNHWVRQQQLQMLRAQLNWSKLLLFLVLLILFVALGLGFAYKATQRQLEVTGLYYIEGKRGPLRLCFFIDGRPVYPKTSEITRNRFRSQLTFHSLRKPRRLAARLRMPGHLDITHKPIPIGTKPSLEVPPLMLRVQGEKPQKEKLPW